MGAMVIQVPENLKPLGEAMVKVLTQVEAALGALDGGKAVEYAEVERQLGAATAGVERAGHQLMLRALDVDRPRVVIDGKPHVRVGRSEASYYTLAGAVPVARTLYREVGRRNAKVVDAVSLRAGVVADGWLPQTAQAMAHLCQQGTSREAQAAARQMGRLPYSRSSFERVAHAVGERYVAHRVDIEQALIDDFAVPPEARTVSVALDRVSLPMEEPRPRPVGRPRKGAARRPIARNFRMAWCATVTLHDRDGQALHTIRYGRMPHQSPELLCQALAGDVAALLRKRPRLRVVTLSDGAADLAKLLADNLSEETLRVDVHRLVDLWHLLEKLGRAAVVIAGAAQAEATIRRWKLDLLNRSGAVEEILAELLASGRREVQVGESRPVHEAITYLENHGDRMDYAAARRLGLPLGSGNVEATCKSLVGLRMKRPGARWKEQTGEHILGLRALALSDRWNAAMRLTLRPLQIAVNAAA